MNDQNGIKRVRTSVDCDDWFCREALTRLLADESSIELVARTEHRPVNRSAPTVVVVDLPAGEARLARRVAIIERLSGEPRPRLIVIDLDSSPDVELLRLGAHGLLSGSSIGADGALIAAIHAAAHGLIVSSNPVDPSTAGLRALRARWGLTRREADVALLLADGLSNKEIALRLHYAPQTVRNIVRIVYTKVGVNRRIDAAHSVHGAVG